MTPNEYLITQEDEIYSELLDAVMGLTRARERRNAAIYAASQAGMSLREIGAAVDMTHEGVRLVVKQEQAREGR